MINILNNKKHFPETQQARVLTLLWYKLGGPYRLAKKLNFYPTTFNVWKSQVGKVPLIHVGRVSRALQVSPYLLNYAEVYDFYGKGDTWKKVLKDSDMFDENEIKFILAGKEPDKDGLQKEV